MIKKSPMLKKHILYIGTTLPTPGFGSSVIIHRHLKRLVGWKISIITFLEEKVKKINLPKDWQIITISEKKRWWPPLKYGISILTYFRIVLLAQSCKLFFRNNKPNVILNQFGKNSLLAYYLSKKWKVPLSLILHDRYEVWTKKDIDKHVTKRMAMDILNHASQVWTVTKELGEFYKLKNPNKISVLPPIPEGSKYGVVEWRNDFAKTPVIAFAGSFHSHQLVHFKNIADALLNYRGEIIIVSKKNEIIKQSLGNISNIKYYKPFEKNEEIINFLKKKASCVLVPDSIDPRAAGSALSFPSRLVEFSHLGLPILVISPRRTALANWANDHSWIGYLESSAEPGLSEKIRMLLNKDEWEKMAKQSRDVALNEFNPERIQKQFEAELLTA